MSASATGLLCLALYALFILGLSWFGRAGDKGEGFAIGGRRIGVWGTAASMIGGVREGGGLTLWIFVGAAMAFQYYWFIVGLMGAFFALGLLAAPLRKLAGDRDYITQSDFVRDQYGPHTTVVHMMIILVFALMSATAQLYVSGQIIALMSGMPAMAGIGLSAFIVAAYLALGGYKTLILTDMAQWIIMTALVAIPLFFFEWPDISLIKQTFFSEQPTNIAGMVFLVFILSLSLPDAWQRIFSLKSPETGLPAFTLAIPFFILVTFGLSFFGHYLAGGADAIAPDNVFEKVFLSGVLPPEMMGLAAIAIAAIAMSTLDTMTYLFTSTLAKNAFHIDPAHQRDKYVRFIRIAVPLFLIPLSIAAAFITDIISYIINSYSFIGFLTPLLLYGMIKKTPLSDNQDRLLALFLSITALIYGWLFFTGGFVSFWDNLIPAGVLAGLMVGYFSWINWRARRDSNS